MYKIGTEGIVANVCVFACYLKLREKIEKLSEDKNQLKST